MPVPAVSRRIIAFLTTPDALQLRATSRKIASHEWQWHNAEGRIRHELSRWRTGGPRAT
jgi:hypothetical protein